MTRMETTHVHTYQSQYHLWTVTSTTHPGRIVLKVRRNLSGKRKGPKLASAMELLSGLDPDTAEGQWVQAIGSSTYGGPEDPFISWVKSFHLNNPSTPVDVEFENYTLVCDAGLGAGAVGFKALDGSHLRVTHTPP